MPLDAPVMRIARGGRSRRPCQGLDPVVQSGMWAKSCAHFSHPSAARGRSVASARMARSPFWPCALRRRRSSGAAQRPTRATRPETLSAAPTKIGRRNLPERLATTRSLRQRRAPARSSSSSACHGWAARRGRRRRRRRGRDGSDCRRRKPRVAGELGRAEGAEFVGADGLADLRQFAGRGLSHAASVIGAARRSRAGQRRSTVSKVAQGSPRGVAIVRGDGEPLRPGRPRENEGDAIIGVERERAGSRSSGPRGWAAGGRRQSCAPASAGPRARSSSRTDRSAARRPRLHRRRPRR